jgi:hypothetical protein
VARSAWVVQPTAPAGVVVVPVTVCGDSAAAGVDAGADADAGAEDAAADEAEEAGMTGGTDVDDDPDEHPAAAAATTAPAATAPATLTPNEAELAITIPLQAGTSSAATVTAPLQPCPRSR